MHGWQQPSLKRVTSAEEKPPERTCGGRDCRRPGKWRCAACLRRKPSLPWGGPSSLTFAGTVNTQLQEDVRSQGVVGRVQREAVRRSGVLEPGRYVKVSEAALW